METPSSTRRVTRSQTLVAVNNSNNNIPSSRKIEESDKGLSKSRTRNTKNQQQDRSALIDITNDSPIVGLAMGSLETPSSAIAKQRTITAKNNTPGSGEALLRGQVKTLLQKVEEEAELSKLSLESRPFLHLVNSPMGLLAPTPMNTPLVPNLSEDGSVNNSGLASVTVSPVVDEQMNISQVVVSEIFDGMKQESVEAEKILITRSLLLDFSEKSESSDSSECSSVVTGESECKDKSSPSPDDDDASIWSMQVNASTHDEDEEDVIEEEEEEEDCEDYYEDEEGEEDDDGGLVDELCAGMSKISVKTMPAGKHTRFVYNSDDEIVDGEEECAAADNEDSAGFSLGVLRLKGLPTPKGKHLRFPLEEDEDN